MSDREGHGGPPGDDDLSLPKATVAKMISGTYFPSSELFFNDLRRVFVLFLAELLPDGVSCSKETRDLIIEFCVGGLSRVLRLIYASAHTMFPRVHPSRVFRGQRDLREG